MPATKSGDPGFSMLPLLIHSDAVPAGARSALMQAQTGSAEQRIDALVAAARVLHHETGLECRDVLEIIGLEAGSCS
jgi:hypothetical protein